jgi:hypothetical protein
MLRTAPKFTPNDAAKRRLPAEQIHSAMLKSSCGSPTPRRRSRPSERTFAAGRKDREGCIADEPQYLAARSKHRAQ